MAKRYSGNLQISVVYDDKGHYRTSVSSGGKHLWSGVVNPAPAGFGPGIAYDSPKAYDEVASSALAFADDEEHGIADEAEFDEDLTGYLIRRSPPSKTKTPRHATKLGGGSAPWYRWLVNYRDSRGKIQQTQVDSTTRRDAIAAASVGHPTGRDFTAAKLSTKPLK